MSVEHKEYIYALAATFFWSTMASAFKLTLEILDQNILQLLLFSSFISVITLFFFLLATKNFSLVTKIRKKHIWSSVILGILNPCMYYLLLFKAYSLLPGQEAGTLNYTWPIALTLLSIPLLKQRIKLVHITAILLSFIGVLIISTKGRVFSLRFTNVTGALLAVGSSFVWALYWIFNVRDKRNIQVKLFMNFCCGFVLLLLIAILTGNLYFPSFSGLIGIVWVGLFEMGLTYVFWLKALEIAPRTSSVSNLVYLSPFLSLFFLQIVVKEDVLLSSIIGLTLIIAGILLQKHK
ncbi:MAG: DMT family transporter [bacterium]